MGTYEEPDVHHRSRASRGASPRLREAVALRSEADGRLPGMCGEDQTRRGGMPLLRRDPRSREGGSIRIGACARRAVSPSAPHRRQKIKKAAISRGPNSTIPAKHFYPGGAMRQGKRKKRRMFRRFYEALNDA